MIYLGLLRQQATIILEPENQPLSSDLITLTGTLDRYTGQSLQPLSIMVSAQDYGYWHELNQILIQSQFIKKYQSNIKKIAIVTDDFILPSARELFEFFPQTECRHFNYRNKCEALTWSAMSVVAKD